MSPLDGRPVHFLITCEHAHPTIPPSCRELLDSYVENCETHRIYDVGALPVAEALADRLKVPLYASTYTRLAIDLNRSLGHPDIFSAPVFLASESLKAALIQEVFIPFRTRIETIASNAIAKGECVVHLSVHSFTKVFNGQRREVDIGILFDRERREEAAVGKNWTRLLGSILPDFVCRANEPYEGAADGHTTALRRRFSSSDYLGFEIELSQHLELAGDCENWAKLLLVSLKKALS